VIALFDSGNSRLHFGKWNGETVFDTVHIPYPASEAELTETILKIIENTVPEGIAACSVSPKFGNLVISSLLSVSKGNLRVARKSCDIGLQVRYDRPENYGIDRALAAYAAYHYFRNSCVVIAIGTAITVDAITEDGTIKGGYIYPGEELMAFALSAKTGLPEVNIGEVSFDLGNSTESCISNAISLGLSGAVRFLVEKASESVNAQGRIMITGGGAERFFQYIDDSAILRPNLVLEGLGLVFEKLPVYRMNG
jgi:type III pantothenate kinase